jgi:predicted Zn-dependent peptidase
MLPAMTAEKLENQREVVKNERKERYDNQPYGDWDERIQALVFPPSHPYYHPVIGSMEDIGAADLDDVADFFKTFYVPNNAVLTLCGDLDPDDALRAVERYFGDIPAGDPIPPIPGSMDIPAKMGETREETVEAEVPLPRVYIAMRLQPFTADGIEAAEVVATILGSGRASRLYRSLVREQKIDKDAFAYHFPLQTSASMLLLGATGYPEADPEELKEALLTEVEGLATVEERELERAVAMTETGLLRRVQQVGERADLLSMFDQYFRDPGRLNTEVDRFRAVSRGKVEDFAGEYLGPDNRAILTYLPGGGS